MSATRDFQIIYFAVRCTSWFNAGSRIIENNLRGCNLLFLAPAGSSNPVGPYTNPLPKPAGQSLHLLNLTCPKMSINFIIFNNRYKQHFITESAQIPIALLLRFILNHTNTFYATLIKIDVLRNLYFV